MKYRADINGLRAVAVLSVVFCHAGFTGFAGGFVGVDIFFVISGFLITSIILDDVRTNTFSVKGFYERRVRRIFPALFVMLAFTLTVAAITLIPSDFVLFGKSLAAAALFYSNYHFGSTTDYFDPAAEEHPLIHTWSLSVEEQFYILWPLLLIIIFRKPLLQKNAFLILLGISTLSLIYACWAVHETPVSAFYSLPSRVWELGLGGLVAFSRLQIISQFARHLVSVAGLGLIAFSVTIYSEQTPFPGFAALAPCLGAAMLIVSGSNRGIVNLILSLPPLRFVGFISYSLYLWHWPILVFARLFNDGDLGVSQLWAAILIAFVAATLSWRYVERPFLRSKITNNYGLKPLRTAAAIMLIFASLGAIVVVGQGLPQRLNVAALKAEEATRRLENEFNRCNGAAALAGDGPCFFGTRGEGKLDIILWGDSHARFYWLALSKMAESQKLAGLILTSSGCPPIAGVLKVDEDGRRDYVCEKRTAANLELIQQLSPRTVVLASRWSLYAETTRAGSRRRTYLIDATTSLQTAEASKQVFAQGLSRTVDVLQKIKSNVLILGQVPEFPWKVGQCVGRRRMLGLDDLKCGRFTSEEAYNRLQWYESVIRDILRRSASIRFFLPKNHLCDESFCYSVRRDEILYSDNNHLNRVGAEFLLPFMIKDIGRLVD